MQAPRGEGEPGFTKRFHTRLPPEDPAPLAPRSAFGVRRSAFGVPRSLLRHQPPTTTTNPPTYQRLPLLFQKIEEEKTGFSSSEFDMGGAKVMKIDQM